MQITRSIVVRSMYAHAYIYNVCGGHEIKIYVIV